ncbi:Alpha-(1,6)-fucosyltransferase [Thelohanellus kitauei]|uniref:Alpha-(1,6)-fucosyltransferase n=1 Tax=Thelohanellus kitauei TaxID=669202 RepID=A0A0C2MHE6_THEKT|nr:Alpha-(1,6)-fucosyltransferase [Thelohanellus kitauei]
MVLFLSPLASNAVNKGRKNKVPSKKQSTSISVNKSIDPPFNYSKFLKEWKKSYISQKEMMLFIFQYANSGMLRRRKVPKYVDFRNYLIDSNLFQLNVLENIRSIGQNEMMRKSLMEYVQKVIHRNQNPKECRNIDVIVYDPQPICGFGCQIHHIAYCLTTALGEGKPLVVKPSRWHEFNSIFDLIMPLSETCRYDMINTHQLRVKSIDVTYDYQVKEFLPQAFPDNIRKQIEEFHTDPFLWWIGQIIMYILRLKPHILKRLKPIEFTSPIVG